MEYIKITAIFNFFTDFWAMQTA